MANRLGFRGPSEHEDSPWPWWAQASLLLAVIALPVLWAVGCALMSGGQGQ